MASEEKSSKERHPFRNILGLVVALGALAIGVDVIGHYLHKGPEIGKNH